MSSDLSGIKKFFTTDPEELIALKRRVMADKLPRGYADAIYCVGGTVDTQDQDLAVAAALWHAGEGGRGIGVLRASTDYGYCGFEFGKQGLIRRGVHEAAIVPIDILFQDGEAVNTYTEMRALWFHSRTNGWKTVIICAPYFHQMRASSTLISRLNREHPELWIFNQPAPPPDFGKKMKHSQGVVEGDLLELFISEFGRLFRYHNAAEGSILSCAELLRYYEFRDAQCMPPR